MNTEKSPSVPLDRILTEEKLLAIRVRDLRNELALAEKELDQYRNASFVTAMELLKEGMSTGDELTDEILPIVGVHSLAIERVRALSSLLEVSKGLELLIRVRYWAGNNLKMVMPIDVDEEDYRWGQILGILSGDRLRMRVDGALILPFAKYTTVGLPGGTNGAFGPLTVSGSGQSEPNAPAILEKIKGSEDVFAQTNQESSGPHVVFYLGDQICYQVTRGWHVSLGQLRQLLEKTMNPSMVI